MWVRRPLDLVPLISDIDGTITATDSLHETLFRALRRNPLTTLFVCARYFSRPQKLKSELLALIGFEGLSLPLRSEVVDFLEQEALKGRKIFLATGAVFEVADEVRKRLPFAVENVFCSSDSTNLAGREKAESLV